MPLRERLRMVFLKVPLRVMEALGVRQTGGANTQMVSIDESGAGDSK